MTTPITPTELNLTTDKAVLYTKLNALLSGQFTRPTPDDVCVLASNPGNWPLMIGIKFPQTGSEVTTIVEDYKNAGWSIIIKSDNLPQRVNQGVMYPPGLQYQSNLYGPRPMEEDLYTILIFTPPMV